MEKSLGEFRMRVEFNPHNDDKVHTIKGEIARLINYLENEKKSLSPDLSDFEKSERFRLIALAQTQLEIAGVLTVKAVTG